MCLSHNAFSEGLSFVAMTLTVNRAREPSLGPYFEPSLSGSRRSLAHFHHIFEAAQVFGDRLGRLGAKQFCNSCPKWTHRGLILEIHLNNGALSSGCVFKTHRACIRHISAIHRTPANPLIFDIVNYFCIPG